MTTGTVKSQGTKIYFAVTDGASSSDPDGYVIHKVACPTEVNPFGGGTVAQIPQTCLDSTRMEYQAGLEDPSPISMPINLIPRSASHQALIDAKATRDVIPWQVLLSDQTDGAPTTVDSNGMLESLGPTTYSFRGYLADFTVQAATNDLIRAQITIQPSGEESWDLPAADLA